ncbi:hypothetical protein VTL71DRAFT_14516 [Oculimacula yallundae]|uniref:Uncharacterized protein n=1 Tax=Oculimacula yallundae TaxID=86028 RepID=A0ABR4CJE0_9HELO
MYINSECPLPENTLFVISRSIQFLTLYQKNEMPFSPIMAPNDPPSEDASSIMMQMTRLSLYPILSAYPSKENDSRMRALIHALETAQAERIRLVAGAINIDQRVKAREAEFECCQKIGASMDVGEEGVDMKNVWGHWVELLRWEALLSTIEERLGLVAL